MKKARRFLLYLALLLLAAPMLIFVSCEHVAPGEPPEFHEIKVWGNFDYQNATIVWRWSADSLALQKVAFFTLSISDSTGKNFRWGGDLDRNVSAIPQGPGITPGVYRLQITGVIDRYRFDGPDLEGVGMIVVPKN